MFKDDHKQLWPSLAAETTTFGCDDHQGSLKSVSEQKNERVKQLGWC